MIGKASFLLRTAAGAAALWSVALGAQPAVTSTTQFTYDALGRLTGVSTSGGTNNGLSVLTGYDAAGNRTAYNVGTGGTAPAPLPSPPQASNQPPVANGDSVTMSCQSSQSVNVIANDTDPDNNVPLVLTGSNELWAQQVSSTNLLLQPTDSGTHSISYTVEDSLGAGATGLLTVVVTGQCQ
jgi:hypothetical protein